MHRAPHASRHRPTVARHSGSPVPRSPSRSVRRHVVRAGGCRPVWPGCFQAGRARTAPRDQGREARHSSLWRGHLRSGLRGRPQVAFHAIRNLVRLGRGAARPKWRQTGFGAVGGGQTPRNLHGFRDGTTSCELHRFGRLAGPSVKYGQFIGTEPLESEMVCDISPFQAATQSTPGILAAQSRGRLNATGRHRSYACLFMVHRRSQSPTESAGPASPHRSGPTQSDSRSGSWEISADAFGPITVMTSKSEALATGYFRRAARTITYLTTAAGLAHPDLLASRRKQSWTPPTSTTTTSQTHGRPETYRVWPLPAEGPGSKASRQGPTPRLTKASNRVHP